MSRKRTREISALLILQHERCYACERSITDDVEVHVDHKKRLVDGGTDEISNKGVICLPCHREKTRREITTQAKQSYDYSFKGINDFISKKVVNAPQQIHNRYSIHQLRGWWIDNVLKIAECNRCQVWDEHKSRSFVRTVLEGGITPSLFVNLFTNKQAGHGVVNIRDLYDGGNRFRALMAFMDGKLHVTYQLGRRTVSVTYGPCKVEGCGRNCTPLCSTNMSSFSSRMMDMFEWSNLSEQEACEAAQHLNEGTPMNMGEKLRLLCGRKTHRAQILKFLYESTDYKKLCTQDRERDRKVLAALFRHIVCPDTEFKSHLSNNFGPFENFYKNEQIVDEKHIKKCEDIICKTVRLLEGRTINQYRILLCFIGILRYDCNIEAALCDDECGTLPVEQLLDRHKVV